VPRLHVGQIIRNAFRGRAECADHVGSLPHPAQIEMWQMNWSVEEENPYASHYLAASGTISLAQYKEWMTRWVFRSRPDLANLALPGELRLRPLFPRF